MGHLPVDGAATRLGAAALALLLVALAPLESRAQACSAGYDGLEVYYGDQHSHAATAYRFSLIDDPNADQSEGCAHSHKSPALAYQQARANGLDFLVISHHSWEIGNGATALWKAREGLDWWTAATGSWASPFSPSLDFAARSTQGFPLSAGGFTDSEIEYLADVADRETTPGLFLGFYGIEYTAAEPTRPTCSPGAAGCGGHKIAVCPGAVDTVCATFGSLAPDVCSSESELYDWATRNGCVLSVAHPCGPGGKADLTPFDPNTAPGGVDDTRVLGYELAQHCIDDPGGRGYTDALDLGYRVSPRFGSDTHNRPGWPWGTGQPPLSEGNPLTDSCLLNSEQPGTGGRMGCWATGLERAAILDAFRLHRCFWVGYNQREPEIALWVADDADSRRWPMGTELEVPDGDVHLDVLATNDPNASGASEAFGTLEIVHAGGVVAAAPCQSGALCSWSQSFDGDVDGYYYARISAASGTHYLLVTAPVWVGPPAPAGPGPEGLGEVCAEGVSFCTPTPDPTCASAGEGRLIIDERRTGKEKFKVDLKKVATQTVHGDLGDPVAGATRYEVCLYDAGGSLVKGLLVDRAGDTCGDKGNDCWKTTKRGFKYKDVDATSGGIRAITAMSGAAGKGKLKVQGQNNAGKGQTALPVGLAKALTGSSEVEVQVVTSDARCFGAKLTRSREEGSRFRARTR
jgi:hypothetical protein